MNSPAINYAVYWRHVGALGSPLIVKGSSWRCRLAHFSYSKLGPAFAGRRKAHLFWDVGGSETTVLDWDLTGSVSPDEARPGPGSVRGEALTTTDQPGGTSAMARTHSTAKYAAIYARVSTAGAHSPRLSFQRLLAALRAPFRAGGTNWAIPFPWLQRVRSPGAGITCAALSRAETLKHWLWQVGN